MHAELVATVTNILMEDERIQLLETDQGAKRACLYKLFHPAVKAGAKVLINVTAAKKRSRYGRLGFCQSCR